MGVSQAIKNIERRKTDSEYRKKLNARARKYFSNPVNRKKKKEYRRDYDLELSKFKNKRCVMCGRLLNFQTKGNVCRKCINSNKKPLK